MLVAKDFQVPTTLAAAAAATSPLWKIYIYLNRQPARIRDLKPPLQNHRLLPGFIRSVEFIYGMMDLPCTKLQNLSTVSFSMPKRREGDIYALFKTYGILKIGPN